MDPNPDLKEKIIQTTIKLIEESGENPGVVTARKIASRAGVALGLINYHFGSKDTLIDVCVQKIINTVVFKFQPQTKAGFSPEQLSDRERLTDWAQQVFDFLFDHSAIASISILSDLQDYKLNNNSVYTQKGLAGAVKTELKGKDLHLLTFMLCSVMQTAFLARNSAGEILGYDFSKKTQRDEFVKKTADLLWNGIPGSRSSKNSK